MEINRARSLPKEKNVLSTKILSETESKPMKT